MGEITRNDHTFETTHATIQIYDSAPPTDDPRTPIILFLHGNSFNSSIWKHIFRCNLSRTHRLVAIDYPGHGASSDAHDPERSYNMPAYADAALQVLQHIDASRSVIVVGWSLGGHVAIEILSRSDRVKGIVITGTPPADLPDQIDKAFTFGPGGWKGAAAARASITEEELQAFAHGCADPPYEAWMEETVRRTDGRARELMFKHFAEGKEVPKDLRFPAIQARRWRQKECVEKSDVPVAVINGKDEPFINLEWVRNIKYNNLWRKTCFELEGGLHAPFWGKTDKEYLKLLEDFVKDVS